MPKIDLTNKEYKYYKVIGRNEERTKANGKNVFWNCICHCGKEFIDTTTNINKGLRKSCGCMKAQLTGNAHFQDLTGLTFGDLVVIERDTTHSQNGKKPRTYWWCQCECGNKISVDRTHLVNRNQSSCGCKSSIGELNINKILSQNNILYKSQYTNYDLKTNLGGYLRFDFAILDDNNKVIRLIEFDGPQHTQTNNYFNDYEEIVVRDSKKNEYAHTNNIPLVRIPHYKRDCITLEDIIGDRFLV